MDKPTKEYIEEIERQSKSAVNSNPSSCLELPCPPILNKFEPFLGSFFCLLLVEVRRAHFSRKAWVKFNFCGVENLGY